MEQEIFCLSRSSGGYAYPKISSISKSTCNRIKNKENDGCAYIQKSIAIKDSRSPTGWLVPGILTTPDDNDLKLDEAIKTAKNLGLTDEQISILMNAR